ncbi:MAG: response regulator [Tannerellaceae bacterium]|jgi:signal transduction histidine kinase/DNA-binding response OmpR family regulator|nr:response regulator [Tannerellaceae bacterium]
MERKVEHLKRRVIIGYLSIILLSATAIVHVYSLVSRVVSEERKDRSASAKTSIITKTLLFLYEGESLTHLIDDDNEDFAFLNSTLDSVSIQLEKLMSYSPSPPMLERIHGIGSLLDEKRSNTILMMEARREINRIYAKHLADGIKSGKTSAKETGISKEEDLQESVMIVRRQRKGFLKRLAEAFVPIKEDTATVKNSSVRLRTDSIINEYNPADTIAHVLKEIQAGIDREYNILTANLTDRINRLIDNNSIISGRIAQILFEIESEESAIALEEEVRRTEMVRKTSISLALIAVVSLLLILIFLYLILRDISRSRYYRKQLLEAKLLAESLLLSREKLMLMIGHDLRAPLSSILGHIELARQSEAEGGGDKPLDNISVLARHMLSLISDLLDFHRLESGRMVIRPVALSIPALFNEIYNGFKPLADSKGLIFELDTSGVGHTAYTGDPVRIRQASANLISNAIKFTQRGRVSVAVSSTTGEAPGRDIILISVMDEGPGIKESEREAIFKEFTRLPGSEKTEGFGLGLSITCKLATLMGGSVSLKSVVGEGSVFALSIPLMRSVDEVVAGGDRAPSLSSAMQGVSCLVIDDDTVQLKLSEGILRRSNIDVTALSDPLEALSLLPTASFDVILTDIQMPLLDGYELLHRIQSLEAGIRKTPVIALSASISEENEHYIEAGFSGFLNKPFTTGEVMEVLNRLFPSRRQSPAEPPLNVSALTAFASDDKEAAASILQTFIEETRKDISILKEASGKADRNKAASISHKLIPTFTMLGAETIVASLRTLEANKETPEDSSWKETVDNLIERITTAIEEISVE